MIDSHEMPAGFTMQLAQNMEAMDVFTSVSAQERDRIIEGARKVNSYNEMKEYINNIANRTDSFK